MRESPELENTIVPLRHPLNIAARSRRNRNVVRANPNVPDYPLVHAYTLTEPEKDALKYACLAYLWHCANVVGQFIPMPDHPDWFSAHARELCLLPNITPNGLVLPKRETLSSYNFLHSVVARIMKRYFIDETLAGIHAPINIRMIDGRPNPSVDSRPRSSTKLHSDIWAAEPANSMAIFLPVLGDIAGTTVEFVEPKAFPVELQKPLDDFELGAERVHVGTRYPPIFTDCGMLVMDTLCLHRTIKNSDGFRLSIDFRVLHKTLLEGDVYAGSPRLQNYVPPDIWYGIGERYMVVSRTSINEVIADRVTDGYAARYDISGL